MKKFTFSNDHETIIANIGVSDEQHKKTFEAAKEILFRAYISDKEMNDLSAATEAYLNKLQPSNEVEFFWAGFVFSQVKEQFEEIGKKLKMAIG